MQCTDKGAQHIEIKYNLIKETKTSVLEKLSYGSNCCKGTDKANH